MSRYIELLCGAFQNSEKYNDYDKKSYLFLLRKKQLPKLYIVYNMHRPIYL